MQTLWSQKDHLVLDGGVLYRRWEDVPGKGFNPHLQLVIPRTSIQAVLKEFHDTPMHLGFGVPDVLHTDQGRNFESTLLKETCLLLGVQKTRTSPYHLQSDGGLTVPCLICLVLQLLRTTVIGISVFLC